MNIKEVRQALELVFKVPQPIVPYIHGKPGIGKSSIFRQIAEARNIGFIDLRLSQLESSDIRGIPIPDLKIGSSRWLPPETIPFEKFADLYIPGDPKNRKFSDGGILLLDEVNRARFDVIQAMFELVLDLRVGLHKVLPTWFIACAGNLGEADKTEVTEFADAALNNRFIHFFIEDAGLFDCWMEWAEGQGKIHSDIVNFLKTKPSALYPEYKEGDVVFVTPRSWEKFSKILNQNENLEPAAVTKILGKNILGTTTVGFLDYLKQKLKISPEEVVNRYPQVKKKIQKLARDEKYSLSNEVVAYVKSNKKMTDDQIHNIHFFVTEMLEKDHMMAIYKTLASTNINYKNREVEFMDPYLDLHPEMNEKIANILYQSKGTK